MKRNTTKHVVGASAAKLGAWTCAAFVVAACSASGPTGGEATGAQASAIVNGTPDSTYTGVGLVWGPDQCTGVLVAPTIVLTAAHCVDTVPASTGVPVAVAPSEVTFYTGPGSGGVLGTYTPTTDPTLTAHAVSQVLLDPNFTLNTAQEGCPNDKDVALLELASPAEGEPTYPLVSPDPAVGTTGTAVGYGDDDGGLIAIRESATSVISSLTAGKYGDGLTVTAGTGLATKGDSGGPLFVGGAIAGIDMCHDLTVIPQTTEWYTRSDEVYAWVTSTVDSMSPSPCAPTTCGSVEGPFGTWVSCTCAIGDTCSDGHHCCPQGTSWSGVDNRCVVPCTSKHCPR
jgi:hypothetical protein